MISIIGSSGCFGNISTGFKGSKTNTRHALVPLAAAKRDIYVGSDGRRKATMEEAFRIDRVSEDDLPWTLSWQRNERQLTFTDATTVHIVKVGAVVPGLQSPNPLCRADKIFGNIIVNLRKLWGQGFAAQELKISGEDMTDRITQLVAILPELPARLSLMKATDVAGCVTGLYRLLPSPPPDLP